MIRSLLRMILGWQFITSEHARELAQRECQARGWEWREPVRISESPTTTRVMTNSMAKGGNVYILLDARTGEVRKSEIAPR